MGRRRFVQTLIALGVSSGTAAALTPEKLEELTDNPEKEVPRLGWYEFENKEAVINSGEKPKPVPKYYTIPRDKWAKIQGPKQAAQQISKKYSDPQISVAIHKSDNSGVGCEVQYRILKDSSGNTIARPKTSFEEVKQKSPTKAKARIEFGGKSQAVENIPVTVSKRESVQELRDCDEDAPVECYYDQRYRPVVGGCEAGAPDNSNCAWTLGAPAWSTELSEYAMVTAEHCVDSNGDAIHQPSGGGYENHLGNVWDQTNHGGGEGDGAVIKVDDDNADVTMGIGDGSGGIEYGVAGMVGPDRLDDLVANDEYVYVQGRRTGRQSGVIQFHDADRSDPQAGYKISTDGGDSGSPVYEYRDGYAYMIGIHTNKDCFDGKKGGKGNTMYHLEDALNLQYS